MFSKAFQLIVKSGKMRAFKELADASATISAAEVWQIQILNKINTTVDEYIRLVTDKTAVLFAAASAVGAITRDCSDNEVAKARNFGLNFGILYQIRDDLLDYLGDESVIGKEIFQDIREGKVTLPLIMLMNHASKDEVAVVSDMIGSSTIDRSLLNNLMKEYEIEAKVQDFSERYKAEANGLIGEMHILKNLLNEL
jgi:octaprenyl-diphosphate synthase